MGLPGNCPAFPWGKTALNATLITKGGIRVDLELYFRIHIQFKVTPVKKYDMIKNYYFLHCEIQPHQKKHRPVV